MSDSANSNTMQSRSNIFRILASLIVPMLFLGIVFFADFSMQKQFLTLFSNANAQSIFQGLYWGINGLVLFALIYTMVSVQRNKGERTPLSNFLIGFAFSVILCKILLLPFLLFHSIAGFFTSIPIFLYAGGGLIGLLFLSMMHGVTAGKYNYAVSNHTLHFEDLPAAFDGFKIAQITDIHSGSFDSKKSVEKGVDLLNEQDADIIVFTGDLVNVNYDEIKPYQAIFSKLKAPSGVYSVLGNHDYSHLIRAEIPKNNYLPFFREEHRKTGFQLLANEHVYLEKNGERIALCGVENWGDPPFPQLGDLNRTLQNSKQDDFRVLLSHDPSHWKAKILPHEAKFHLTLSGHTHAMQFAIDFLGIKWSPVQYKYKEWMGMYEQANQYLYVNRGFGFIGFPGRVGTPPEISVFELKKK